MDRLFRIEATEAVRALKTRYFRAIDGKLWSELPHLFTHDLKIISPDGQLWLEGGNAYAASLEHSLKNAVSSHQGLGGEIDIIDAENARAIWAMRDVIVWDGRHPREGWKSITGEGHYHETYRREKEGWRIATLMLIRDSLDIEWPEGQAPS